MLGFSGRGGLKHNFLHNNVLQISVLLYNTPFIVSLLCKHASQSDWYNPDKRVYVDIWYLFRNNAPNSLRPSLFTDLCSIFGHKPLRLLNWRTFHFASKCENIFIHAYFVSL